MVKANLPPAGHPLLDPRTGFINTEWYLALKQLLARTGGTAEDLVGTALHVDTNGIVVATGSGDGTAITRSIASGTGISVTNGSGVSGNPTINSTITQYTDEMAQDAVGAMVDTTLVYTDATPLLSRAALTGDVTASAGSNATTLANSGVSAGSYTNADITVDAKGRVTAAANGSAAYTNEQAQDAVGGILTGLAYNDSTPSISAIRVIQIQVSDPAGSAITTGDGKAYFRVNSQLNGYNLTAVAAAVTTVSSSGIPTVQIHNVTDAVDMLSTKLTIDQSETDSSTAATPAVIDGAADDVATADMLRIDIDVAGTGAKGLIVELTFTLP